MSKNILSSLSASDIATLAGVSRGAVSNWRRRHKDFPKPLEDVDGLEFDAEEVREWLTSRGYEIKSPDVDEALWSVVNALRDESGSAPYTHLLVALFAIRKRTREPLIESNTIAEDFEAMGAEQGLKDLDQFKQSFRVLQESGRLDEVEAIIDSIPFEDFGKVTDKLLERRGFGRSHWETGLNPESSRILARAVGKLPEDATVLDLACGRAGTLFDVASRQTERPALFGSDIVESSLDIARLRAYLHDIPVTLKSADVLEKDPFPGLKADAVVIEPPFGLHHGFEHSLGDPRWLVPPRTVSTDIAWIQLAASYLSPRGRGFVLSSSVPIRKGGVTQQTRAELVRSGLVEAIVELPRGVAYGTSIPTFAWVVSRDPDREAVLFVDASHEDLETIDIAKWLAKPESAPTHRLVPVRELMSGDVNLNPQMWLIEPFNVEEHADHIEKASTRLSEALTELSTQKAPIMVLDLPKAPMVSLRTLHERGYLKIRAVRKRHSKDVKVLKPADFAERVIDSNFANDGDFEIGVTDPLPRILVSTLSQISAAVDEVGIARLSPHISIVEVDPTRLNPYFVTALLMTSRNARFLQGGTFTRARVGDLEIPLLPLEEQQKIAEAVRDAWKLRQTMRRADADVIELLSNYVDYTVETTNPQ